MTSFKSLRKIALITMSSLVLAGCSATNDTGEPGVGESPEVAPPSQSYSPKDGQSGKEPSAPSISNSPTEYLEIDKGMAKKLASAGKKTANKWFIDQMHGNGVSMDDALLIVVRDRICHEIDSGATMYTLVNKTLSPYDLSGKQSGAMIAGSMLSSCYNAKLAVPQGTNEQLKNNN